MLKKISISDLTVDMYVAEIIASSGAPMPKKKRGMVRDRRIIDKFIEIGIQQVVIDTTKGLDFQFSQDQSGKATEDHEIDQDIEQNLNRLIIKTGTHYQDLHLEWGTAKDIFRTSVAIVSRSIAALKGGDTINRKHFDEAARAITKSILRNKDALTWLGKIRDTDKYLFEHSVNTSVLMGIFAKAYGLNSKQVEQCITGALLHDLGQAYIQEEVFIHERSLSNEEYGQVKQHVNHGVNIITDEDSIEDIVTQIVQEHHERYDGSGYPNKLKGEEISLFGRMFAIVDTYDAVTNNRIYKKAVPSSFAMRTLLELSGSHFDESLVHVFIKSMGVYPTGSLVKLNNGFLTVVIAQNPDSPLKPLVKTVYNTKTSAFIEPRMLNLLKPNNNEKIVSYEDPRNFDIRIDDFMPDEIDF